jgi:hypothetical protein
MIKASLEAGRLQEHATRTEGYLPTSATKAKARVRMTTIVMIVSRVGNCE